MAVIVLVADGVRLDTLAHAVELGELPAMARLRESGGMYDVTSVFPSVTGPAYTPFIMGRFPGSVGMPGLRWYDRSRTVCSFPDYSRSYVGYQMRAVDRDVEPAAPTIFEIEQRSSAALSVITRGLPRSRQITSLTPRSAVRAALTHFRGNVDAWLDVDREISDAVVDLARRGETRFLFAAFTGVDKMSHARGHDSGGVKEALRIVDRTVGNVLDETKRSGPGETHIWVTSDHGHSPVAQHEDLARVIEEMGQRVIAHPWVYRIAPTAAVMVSGNAMAHIYLQLRERRRPFLAGLDDASLSIADRLLERESVDLLIVPTDAESCEVRSRRGVARVRSHDGRFNYTAGDGDPLGIGQNLEGVDADAAHEATLATDYPDSIVQIASLIASERCGDIVVSASRDWDFRARYEPIPHVSSHGALHREHMMVPLLLDRPPKHRPRRTTDVMPSALTALGHAVPDGLDGVNYWD